MCNQSSSQKPSAAWADCGPLASWICIIHTAFDRLPIRKGNLGYFMPSHTRFAAVLALGMLSAATNSVMAESCKLYQAIARLSAPMTFVRISTVPHKVLLPWSPEGAANETGIVAEGRIVPGT